MMSHMEFVSICEHLFSLKGIVKQLNGNVNVYEYKEGEIHGKCTWYYARYVLIDFSDMLI